MHGASPPARGSRRLSALGGAAFACVLFLLYNESIGSGVGAGSGVVRGGGGGGGTGGSGGGGAGVGTASLAAGAASASAAAPRAAAAAFPLTTPTARCAVPPGRRLAILQVRWYHTEVFGSLIEYARACGHELVVFHRAGHATSALPLYERLFSPLSVRDPGDFRAQHEGFDAIFLTTPDDDIDEALRKSIQHRTIYAAHLTHPKFLHRWHTLRLHMTPLAGFPYAIPVFAGGQAVLPAAGRERTIAMIGTVHDGQNYEIAKIMEFASAAMADGWRFVVFTRHWGAGEAPPFGVEMVQDANTEAVYERIRKCSFVLIFPGKVRVVACGGGQRASLRVAALRCDARSKGPSPTLTPPALPHPRHPPAPAPRAELLVHVGPHNGRAAAGHLCRHAHHHDAAARRALRLHGGERWRRVGRGRRGHGRGRERRGQQRRALRGARRQHRHPPHKAARKQRRRDRARAARRARRGARHGRGRRARRHHAARRRLRAALHARPRLLTAGRGKRGIVSLAAAPVVSWPPPPPRSGSAGVWRARVAAPWRRLTNAPLSSPRPSRR